MIEPQRFGHFEIACRSTYRLLEPARAPSAQQETTKRPVLSGPTFLGQEVNA